MSSKVVIKKCSDYDYDKIKQVLEASFSELHIQDEIPRDGKVFVKVNNLMTVEHERAVTTHPIVLKAVLAYVKQFTNNIIVGDDVNEVLDNNEPFVLSGIKSICDEMGVTLYNLKDDERVQVRIQDAARVQEVISMKSVTRPRSGLLPQWIHFPLPVCSLYRARF